MIKAEGWTHAVRSLLPSAPPNPKNKQPECLSSADCDFGPWAGTALITKLTESGGICSMHFWITSSQCKCLAALVA